MEALPMFPLGMVLFPGAVVPLRLFEDRYLKLFDDLVAGDGRFGVVLIERGSESGGDDVRFATACVARMVGAAPQDDGSVMTVNVGSERIRIVEWLADDPYPRALVSVLDDGVPDIDVDRSVAASRALVSEIRGLLSELGGDIGESPELSADSVKAVFEIAHLLPIQPLDQQKILQGDDPLLRAETLRESLEALSEILRLELALGR
jgi:uncharacterized protein